MQLLEQNEIEKLVSLGCDPVFDWSSACQKAAQICRIEDVCGNLRPCPSKVWCFTPFTCGSILKCGLQLAERLSESLTACGEGFYVKCPGFERIEQDWPEFAAVKAARLKEQTLLDRISKLEAKVEQLESKK